jgi:hypothetical protein
MDEAASGGDGRGRGRGRREEAKERRMGGRRYRLEDVNIGHMKKSESRVLSMIPGRIVRF